MENKRRASQRYSPILVETGSIVIEIITDRFSIKMPIFPILMFSG